MKKLTLICLGVLSYSLMQAQDVTDALRYSQNTIEGTARYRALGGAFGALGGDLSALSSNPAGGAVFTQSNAAFSLAVNDETNDTNYFNGFGSISTSQTDLSQAGVVFVFKSYNGSPWQKFAVGITYDRTSNFNNTWNASGTNTNDDGQFSNSIASYFYDYADGLRLDEISALPNESLSEAFKAIGDFYGFANQQAFLGFESFLLEPEDINNDANTVYYGNVAPGNFTHDYTYAATGYNGKASFNLSTQYQDNLYLGLNLNTHFINYNRSTILYEDNNNPGSVVNYAEFNNTLATTGNGFSFQLGGILKLGDSWRLGAVYDSPSWYNIDDETTQYLATDGDNGFVEINPQVVNVYPTYKLQTPSQFTGSVAYVFGQQGLISFDYSVKDYSKTKFKPESDAFYRAQNNAMANILDVSQTYRLGGEYKIDEFSLRGGYRFEGSPYKNGVTIGDLTGYSFGIGYNFGNTRLDLTYDKWERTDNPSLYNVGLVDTASIKRSNSNIIISLSLNI